MDRVQLLRSIRSGRFEWDELVASVPAYAMAMPPPGHTHSPKEVIAHVAAYERWVAERLNAARQCVTTDLAIDRDGWRRYNETLWDMLTDRTVQEAMDESRLAHMAMLAEVEGLDDEDLTGRTALVEAIDPRWLEDTPLWQSIATDTYEHYRMHRALMEAAARSTPL